MRNKGIVLGIALVLGVAGLVTLTACGSNGQSAANGQPSPVPTGVSEPLPTVDPNAPLSEYQSPDKGYAVSYPQGWEQVVGGTVDSFVGHNADGKVAAQLTVACLQAQPGWTPEVLMTMDSEAASQAGAFQSGTPTDIEVGGSAGKERLYTINVAGLAIEHIVVYIIRGDCGWRIGLNSYGQNSLASYIPLFRRILASFRFQ